MLTSAAHHDSRTTLVTRPMMVQRGSGSTSTGCPGQASCCALDCLLMAWRLARDWPNRETHRGMQRRLSPANLRGGY